VTAPPVFQIRQGDWGRALSVQIRNVDNSPISPIPGGSTATFTMVEHASGHRVTGAASISGDNSDVVTYTFANGDTAKPGRYVATFTVTYAGGAGVETFPTTSEPLDALLVEVCPAA
jgi:hypothetical protein